MTEAVLPTCQWAQAVGSGFEAIAMAFGAVGVAWAIAWFLVNSF